MVNIGILACTTAVFSQHWNLKGSVLQGDDPGDNYGRCVSLSNDGKTLAVGAPYKKFAGFGTFGSVNIYTQNDTGWEPKGDEITVYIDANAGYSVDLNADGNTIVIGSPGIPKFGESSGMLNIYDWDGRYWVKRGSDIMGDTGSKFWQRRVKISADGNTVATSAVDFLHYKGITIIYEWSGKAWKQKGGKLIGDGIGELIAFSMDLSANGNQIALGSPFQSFGVVRTYFWNESEWVKTKGDIIGENNYTQCGYSLSLSSDGKTIAVSSPYYNAKGREAGYVRIFDMVDSNWVQRGNFIPGKTVFHHFGHNVSIDSSGNTVAVASENAPNVISMFKWSGSEWQEMGSGIEPPDKMDYATHSLSISAAGNTVAVGTDHLLNDTLPGTVGVYSYGPKTALPERTAPSVVIFPNPVSGKIHIELDRVYTDVVIETLSPSGQLLRSAGFGTGQSIETELNGTPGIYFLRIHSNEGMPTVVKVIKE